MTIAALTPGLAGIELKSPGGATWEFLILFLVVIVGPPLMTRARVPGIIGLLVGGFVIGPYGLNLIGAGNTTVPDLGQLGLLYLMFVAGVELDLALIRSHRRAVVVYGVLTFALPMLFGTAIGLALGWIPAAALLLGALLSSHTLLLYPTARAAGLSADRGVATAVGATVLTDTAALVVLAAVSGTQVAGGSPASIAAQIVLGLAVLVAFTMVALPRLARLAFRYLGTDRVVRYLLAVASFLAAGTVADVFGIEPIVGAFFAGLALNRLVPNEGPLMDRIDFFGSAVFVPIFLVSVGLLLDPGVMVEAETLKLAGLFILASLAGKAASAGIARLALGYSGPQATLMLGLTVPQAAATLAATIVGFNIGLFDQSVVNAALVLILVSIVVGTLLVDRSVPTVPSPEAGLRVGSRILVVLTDPGQARLAFGLAARIAAADGGVVRGMLAAPAGEMAALEARVAELQAAGYAAGVDAEARLLVHHSLAPAVVDTATEGRASLVILGASTTEDASLLGSDAEAIAAGLPVPVAVLLGSGAEVREVEVVREAADRPGGGAFDADGLAIDLGRRIGGADVEANDLVPESLQSPRPGLLRIMPVTSWQLLAGAADPGATSAVLLLPDL